MFKTRVLLICIIVSFLWPAYGPKEATGQKTNATNNTSVTTTIVNATTTANITAYNANTSPMQRQEDGLRTAKSKEILNHMNLSANPCEDFYEYACGNWNKYHTPTGKSEEETQDTLLEKKINKDLHHLLDENATIEDSTAARKVKVFYKSCLETRRNEEQHQIFLKEFIKGNGGFPAVPGSNWLEQHHSYNWQHIVAALRYNYGLDILIGIDIDINYQNVYENSIYLTEPSTFIPRHLCSQKATQRIEVTDHVYDAVEQEVADNLKLWLSLKTEDSLKLAADIVTFEYDLCKGMYVNDTQDQEEFIGSLVPEKYDRKSLLELNHLYNNSIDFNTIVCDSFAISINKPVFMKSPAYYEQLLKVIDEYNDYDRTVVANYIMYRAMSHITLPLNDTPLNRPAYCLQVVKKYFPKVLGEIYHRQHANDVEQEAVQDMFGRLKQEFNKAFRQDWIDENTGRLGKNKLLEIELKFPTYEKNSLNLEFVRNDYWKNLKLVMADVRVQQFSRIFATGLAAPKDEVEAYETRVSYRPYHKRIDVGWSILQSPYYNSHLPNSMRYAAMGQKLAQSVATIFNDYGWRADINGYNNWDPQTTVEYYKRTNCFREQICNYLSDQPQCFSHASKTRQLIAKSAGLNIAFNAYTDWLLYQHPINDQATLSKETLTNLDFSNTQLFFITFAQMQCKGQQKPKKPVREVLISPFMNHSIMRYEANGPLRNFMEFGREFWCPLGSEMNVADKCIIY